MKKLLVLCSLVVMLVGLTGFNAAAQGISGGISFAGGGSTDNNANLLLATQFTSFNNVVVLSDSGDYSVVPFLQPVTFNAFSWNPLTPSIVPLWTFNFSSKTYSFDATTMSVPFNSSSDIVVTGLGTAHITGFTDTPGTWSVTANVNQSTFSFSASSGAPVPEPGTLLLLGFGLVGLVGAGRKVKK